MQNQMYSQQVNNQQPAPQVDVNQYQSGTGYANAEVSHDDPRVWKPRLDPSAGIVNYQARVRLLPCGGIDGLKNNYVPVRQVPMHYLRDDATQTHASYKCRHGLSGNKEIDVRHSRNEKCPFCDNLFLRLKALRASDPNPSDAKKTYITRMLPSCEWYANVYIIEDFVNPANNGTVKLWKMSNKLCSVVMEPSPIPKSLFDVRSKNAEPVAAGKVDLSKKIAKFKPEDPIHGHVFNFILGLDKTKKGNVANDYSASNYEDSESLLAGTNDEINAILSQCSDLHEAAEGILGEAEATAAIQGFWADVDRKIMEQSSSYAPAGNGYGQQYSPSAGYAAAYPAATRQEAPAYFMSGNAPQQPAYQKPDQQAYTAPRTAAPQAPAYQQPAQAAYTAPQAPVPQQPAYQKPAQPAYSVPQAAAQQRPAYSAPSAAPTDDDDLPF